MSSIRTATHHYSAHVPIRKEMSGSLPVFLKYQGVSFRDLFFPDSKLRCLFAVDVATPIKSDNNTALHYFCQYVPCEYIMLVCL